MDEREGEKEKEGGRERGNEPNLQPCRYMAVKRKTVCPPTACSLETIYTSESSKPTHTCLENVLSYA